MVTEKELFSSKYKYKHIETEVLEKDEYGNVFVFSAKIVTTKLPNQPMSDGHMEINRTLWDQQSPKRPPGYWVLGSPENEGVLTSVFASDEWLEQTPKEKAKEKREAWNV